MAPSKTTVSNWDPVLLLSQASLRFRPNQLTDCSADRLYADPALSDPLNNHTSSIGDIRRSKISGL